LLHEKNGDIIEYLELNGAETAYTKKPSK